MNDTFVYREDTFLVMMACIFMKILSFDGEKVVEK